MPRNSDTERSEHQADANAEPQLDGEALTEQAIDTVQSALDVVLSRAALAVTEAKVAAISLVLVVVLALLALIIVAATWGLASYALGYWLGSTFGWSMGKILLSVIAANLVLLVLIGLASKSLISDITLKTTLSASGDATEIKEQQS